MRIGIDARFLTHPQQGGFKTYSENLVTALSEIDPDNEYFLYLDRAPNDATALPKRTNFVARVVHGDLPFLGMPWREQVGLSRQAARDKLDLLHSPCLTAPLRLSCPSVVTIHDMIWHHQHRTSVGPRLAGKRHLMGSYYQYVPKFSADRAAAVITVSDAAKASIVQELNLSQDQVFVTYEGASEVFRPLDRGACEDALRKRFSLAPGFLLAIGSADRRKNVDTLLRAYAKLSSSVQNRHDLVVVWTHHLLASDIAEKTRRLGLTRKVQFLESVSTDELVLLYNAASVFIFPSREEGFGLPLVEAMSCGTPVVAADNSSIPEIAGGAALLVNAEDAEGMANATERLLLDASLRHKLGQKGLARAAEFSWAKCARETIEIYRQVCHRDCR